MDLGRIEAYVRGIVGGDASSAALGRLALEGPDGLQPVPDLDAGPGRASDDPVDPDRPWA